MAAQPGSVSTEFYVIFIWYAIHGTVLVLEASPMFMVFLRSLLQPGAFSYDSLYLTCYVIHDLSQHTFAL
jgi:hypothetical protein